jgi:hypothetical protein
MLDRLSGQYFYFLARFDSGCGADTNAILSSWSTYNCLVGQEYSLNIGRI